MVDYHVHTAFSFDSETPPALQLARAAALGLREICFTEHMEYDPAFAGWRVSIPAYRAFFETADTPVSLRRGLELGVDDHPALELLRADLAALRPDFTLLSVHAYRGLGPFDEAFFDLEPLPELCRHYIGYVERCVAAVPPALYCALGHLDYLAKGFGRTRLPGGVWRCDWAPEETDALLRRLIGLGKCIEINTSTWPDTGGAPGLDWLRRYRELGGEYVTFGSDAHTPDRLGRRIPDAMKLARAASLRWYATFEEMEPRLHAL